MQAKDIPELPVLEFVRDHSLNVLGALIFPGSERSVGLSMPAETPQKVALAKMRSLLKRGLVDGCGCGCRGDFTITTLGLERIAESNLLGGPIDPRH